ncbi:alpha/beta fold hydrolase [Ancylobacter mangrovi]|uniref:alpha/beta fold hydrolase n=1 Tax=Ancylobacter mangrovi TaxID=2972472 RepID=UPI002163D6B3|nr:alpha/beta hydrolase [Ancylobacter mangrovi]MCS0500829.1 alpha/beta hydrolase [Ancylobacter mangrovi]
MPIFPVERGEIYYEVTGRGHPLLLFAPGFLGSRIAGWRAGGGQANAPLRNPVPALARSFRVITLDVRNAGRSWAEIGPDYDWPLYTADHVALLDEVGAERCHVLGSCFGASFALALAHAAPERVSALVLHNPVGLSGDNRELIEAKIANWTASLAGRPDVSPSALRAVGPRMFGRDFVFSITRHAAGRITAPTLLMPGDDRLHPPLVSAALARLTRAELFPRWQDRSAGTDVLERVSGFLHQHTPGRTRLARGRP